MKNSPLTKVGFIFITGTLFLILIFLLSFFNLNQYIHQNKSATSSQSVILNLENIISGLKDAEAGYRGYLLSNDQSYLNNYQGAYVKIQENLFKIRLLKNPGLERIPDLMDSLDLTVNVRFKYIDSLIQYQLNGRHEDAFNLFKTKKGKATMDVIHQIVDSLRAEEEKTLATYSSSLEYSNKYISFYIIIFTLIGSGLTGTSFYIVIRDVKRRLQAEKQLITSENKFRSLFEQSREATILLENETIANCNEAALLLFKLTDKESIIGKTPVDLTPCTHKFENTQKRFSAYLHKLHETGGLTKEWIFEKSNCKKFIAELSLTHINIGHEQHQVYLVIRNITQKKISRKKLIKSQSIIKKVADATPDIISVIEYPSFKVKYTNQPENSVLGIEKGLQLIDKIHPEDRVIFQAKSENLQLYKSKKVISSEYRFKDKDGNWRWLNERSKIFSINEKGDKISLISVITDITNKKKVEEEFKTAKKVLEGLYANLPIVIITVDPEGTILESLGSGLNKFKISEGELNSKNIFLMRPDYESAIKEVFKGIPQIFISHHNYQNEEIYFQNFYFHDSERNLAIGLAIDITPLKKYESVIQKKNIELENTLQELRLVESNLKALNKDLDKRVTQRTIELTKSEERFRLVSTVTNDAVWDYNVRTGEIWRNDGYKIPLGWQYEVVEPNLDSWKQRIHPKQRDEVYESFYNAIENKDKQWTAEYHFLKPDGNYSLIKDKGYLLYDNQGEVYRMIGSMLDITKSREAKRALLNSEEEYRSLVRATSQIVWSATKKGYLDYVAQWEEVTGQSKDEMQGLGWIKVLHPDDREKTILKWLKAIKKKVIFELQYRIINKEGNERYYFMRGVPVFKNGKELRKWIGTCTDIHDRKLAEENLQKERELLKNILSTIPHSVFWKNKDLIYMGCNSNFARDLGYSDIHSIEKKTDYELFSYAEAEHFKISDLKVLNSGKPLFQYEEEVTSFNNNKKTLLTSKVPLRNNLGEVIGILGVYSDISQRKEIENAIRQSEEELRAITDTLPIFISYVDSNKKFRFNNKKYEEWYVKEPYMIYGMEVIELLGEEEYIDIEHYLNKALAGEAVNFERQVKKDVDNFHFSVSFIPHFIDGKVHGIYVSESDITEIKETDEVLKQTLRAMHIKNHELNRINQLLDTFVYAAAHDLKTPVTNLKMGVNLLFKVQEENQLNSIKEGVNNSINRLEQTINGLVQVIEIQSTENKAIKELNFQSICDNLILENQNDIEEIRCKIKIDFLSCPTITFIEAYLVSILKNLLSNSIKYASTDNPEVSISTKKLDGFVLLKVADNGIGMDLDKYGKNLFKPFARFSKNKTGKGIGLHLVKTMIEKNGGKIVVKSRINEGTQFFCYLKEYI
jgi:PAS domain S-box-containing protein